MRKIYSCNERGMIHIYNKRCEHSRSSRLKAFDTEDEARQYAGISAHFCKTCATYRDEVLKKEIKKEMESDNK